MEANTYIQHQDLSTGIVARWRGGEYIDVGYIKENGEFSAQDVINVWDYETGQATISNSYEIETLLNEYINDYIT